MTNHSSSSSSLFFLFVIIISCLLFIKITDAATNVKTRSEVLPDADRDPVVAESRNVILLFDDNFEQEVPKYEYVLVHFYASWGQHDAALGPILSRVADLLAAEKEHKLNTVKIAQIEAVVGESKSDHSLMAQKYGIQGFPAVKLFFEGNFVEDYPLKLPHHDEDYFAQMHQQQNDDADDDHGRGEAMRMEKNQQSFYWRVDRVYEGQGDSNCNHVKNKKKIFLLIY